LAIVAPEGLAFDAFIRQSADNGDASLFTACRAIRGCIAITHGAGPAREGGRRKEN
jgi:hypothetical protein